MIFEQSDVDATSSRRQMPACNFFERAKADPGRTAIVNSESGEHYSRRQVAQRAERMAQWLAGQGLGAGHVFAVFLENRIEYLELGLAARLAGVYMVPINTHLAPDGVAYILANSGAELVIASAKTLPALHKIECGIVPACWTIDGDDSRAKSLPHSLEDFHASRPCDFSHRPVGRELIYTSGTTGRPKGVLIPLRPATKRGTVTPGDLKLAEALDLDDNVVYLHPAPLYHSAPLRYSLRVLDFGGQVVLMDRFDPERSLLMIERYRVTHTQWVPTMFKRMLDLPAAARHRDLASHRVAIHAAAPCPVSTKLAMLDWWGDILVEYYAGSEEQGTTIITSHEWRQRSGSVGRAVIGEIHVVDEGGAELEQGEIGNVYFSGGSVFEYLADSDKTNLAINSRSWGTYGDIGHVDENGYLYLSDRRADLILSGGVNIYPQEIENVLLESPDIEDVAVVGMLDPDLGECPLAVAVAAHGREPTESTVLRIADFARKRLTGMQEPRLVIFVDKLPRSEAGKLLRRTLKDAYRSDVETGIRWPKNGSK